MITLEWKVSISISMLRISKNKTFPDSTQNIKIILFLKYETLQFYNFCLNSYYIVHICRNNLKISCNIEVVWKTIDASIVIFR